MDIPYKNVVILNDWHIGSPYSIWPSDFRASNGAMLTLNEGQEYLLQCRDHMLEILPQRIDVLIFNGDMADGQNPAEQARMLMEADPSFQRRAAFTCVKSFVDRADEVYATTGSRYHNSANNSLDREIAEMAGAVKDKFGRYARPFLLRDVDGVLLSVHHHQSTTIRYQSMPVEREIDFALEYCADTGDRVPDVFVAAHVHWGFGMWLENGKRMSISSPCMKLQDDYARSSRYPWRWRAKKLGITWLKVYNEPVNGFRVWPDLSVLYDHPKLGGEVEYGKARSELLDRAVENKSGD